MTVDRARLRQAPAARMHDRARSSILLKQLVIFYAAIAALLLALFSRDYLPAQMLWDDGTLQEIIHTGRAGFGTKYGATAILYVWLGLGNSPVLVSIVAVGMLLVSVLLALKVAGPFGRTWPATALASGTLVLGGIYLGMYTKEFFVVPLVALFIASRGRWWQEAIWIGACLLYAAHVREYWFLVAALYVAFRIGTSRVRSFGWFVAGWVVLLGMVVVAMNVFLGQAATYFRFSTNDKLWTDRETILQDPIVSSLIPAQWLNLILVVLLLLFPVILLLAGSALHVVSALAIATMWTFVLRSVHTYFNGRVAREIQFERALSLLLAFLTVQSLFEPDYGSYLRHLIPLMPLAIIVIGVAARPRQTK
ncbi:hypothetical protein [Agromyces sp. PvR057]|uniref:hypothetical protein n=1 Tax=Agromyces sp. PvR057 TaxID=3156403 RepID=UPI003390F36B